jgi:hypothetical protein
MWEGVRLCGDHYREKRSERDSQLQREQQARNAAMDERAAKEKQEQQRAQEDRAAKIEEAQNQIPGLVVRLCASSVPPENFRVFVKGKWRRREGWRIFEYARSTEGGHQSIPYYVTTKGEFIWDGNSGHLEPYDYITIANRLRRLLSGLN